MNSLMNSCVPCKIKCIIKWSNMHYSIYVGVKGAQVEELWSLDDKQFDELK